METTKVFQSGNSQAVRIPHHLRLCSDTVYIRQIGSMLLLIPTDDPWASLFLARELLSDDFPEERDQLPWQERDWSE